MNKYLAAKCAKEREKRQPQRTQRTQRENTTNLFTISGKDTGIGSREPVYF